MFAVEGFGAMEEEGVWEVGRWRDADEEVEVVGEDAVGDDFDAAEVSQREEEVDEVVFGWVVEEELACDGARDAVVDGAIDLDPGFTHVEESGRGCCGVNINEPVTML